MNWAQAHEISTNLIWTITQFPPIRRLSWATQLLLQYSQSVYRVGALNWSILVFVRLAGNGVGAFDARYGVMDGIEAENEEKYSAANWTTSSGFLSNRNWRKSANRFFSSGCERMYVVWSPFNSSWKQQRWFTFS